MNDPIEKFLEFSRVHASIEYGDSSSVKAANNAADSMRSIAARLVETGRTEELLELLDNDNAGPWVAFSVAELPQVTKVQKERCLKLIRSVAAGDSVDSMGQKCG